MGSSIPELKTNPSVLNALQKAASRKLSNKELLEQRVSFVYGSMDVKSDVTREHIKEVIVELEGLETCE